MDSMPVCRENAISHNKRNGIYLRENSHALIEDNDISSSNDSNIDVGSAAAPTIRHNKVSCRPVLQSSGVRAAW